MRATGGSRARQHSRGLIFPGLCPSIGSYCSQLERSGRVNARFGSSIAGRFGADCLLKVFALFAAAGAEFRQDGELFLGLLHIAGLDIELAEVLAGSLVVWLKFKRLGVVSERSFEVAGLAQGEPEQIVDIGLLGIFGQIS